MVARHPYEYGGGGRAYVAIGGKRIDLGWGGTVEPFRRYHLAVDGWMSQADE